MNVLQKLIALAAILTMTATLNSNAHIVDAPGVGTPGFWKNHPEAWPVATINVGGVDYSVAAAIAIMSAPASNDKTYSLARHLIAAKLNVLAGNEHTCIDDVIASADGFLMVHPVGSGLRANSSAWQTVGSGLFSTLVAYNEGLLCAESRD